jgi:hypothetical protein
VFAWIIFLALPKISGLGNFANEVPEGGADSAANTRLGWKYLAKVKTL